MADFTDVCGQHAFQLEHASRLVNFINESPSPFHAVEEVKATLQDSGFVEIFERDPWEIVPGGKYFMTRNLSTIIAFAVGAFYTEGNGFAIIGGHTDSPCLKLKPISKRDKEGYSQVGVQLYGGGIWHTWLDRDLGVAGRCVVREGDVLEQRLVHINRPVMSVPNICIHLHRQHNDNFTANKETQLVPIIGLTSGTKETKNEKDGDNEDVQAFQMGKHSSQLLKALGEELRVEPQQIVDMELCLVDTQPAAIGGAEREFVYAPRLDNLFNCYAGMRALIDSCDTLGIEKNIRMLSLFDNEEIGSMTAQGAGSALQGQVCGRIARMFGGSGRPDALERAMARSFLLSADQAHAVHPNYSEKHEDKHRVAMDGGMVLKINANQRYATTSCTGAVVREVARRARVPLQDFVVRNDSACGSTIGPIMASKLGCATADVGGPQLAMHSIREMCGLQSVGQAVELYEGFYNHYTDINDTFKFA